METLAAWALVSSLLVVPVFGWAAPLAVISGLVLVPVVVRKLGLDE